MMDEAHSALAAAPAPPQTPYRITDATPDSAHAPIRPLRRRELIAILAIVALADVALLDADGPAAGGFGLAAFLGILPVVIWLSARAWHRSARLSTIVAGLTLVVVRTAVDPTVLTATLGLVLCGALAVALRRPRSLRARLARSIGRTLLAYPNRVAATWGALRRVSAGLPLRHLPARALVVPALVSATFVALFGLANPVVADGLATLADALRSGLWLPGPGRVFVWVIALAAGIAVVRPSVALIARPQEKTELTATRASRLTAQNTLVAVNVVFLAYNAVEARYLFSGWLPEGMTTQTYAHQGALWLTVALAALTVVVGLLFRGPLSLDPAGRLARRLALAWVGQGLIVAASAYWRIAIHIQHSGLSNLRIVGVLGTTLVVVGVLLVGLKVRRAHPLSWLVAKQLDALLVTTLLFAVAPTHAISTAVNVARIERGAIAPLLHMPAQSEETESVALLIPLLEHRDPRVHRGVAALLERQRAVLSARVASRRNLREADVLSLPVLAALEAASPNARAVLGDVDPIAAVDDLERLAYSE